MGPTASNVLATVFFGLAFLWFLVAVSYALSVMLFLKMRREGRFNGVSLNDPAFGRYYICGERYYLPMGWVFRRFILQYQYDQQRRANQGRAISKSERRAAMEKILEAMTPKPDPDTSSSSSSESDSDIEAGASDTRLEISSNMTGDDAENLCSICLGEYSATSSAWKSPVCDHCFHRDCLLEWLQQPGKTDCPCCRQSFVEEDVVWSTVKKLRRKRRETSSGSKKIKKGTTAQVGLEDLEAPSVDSEE